MARSSPVDLGRERRVRGALAEIGERVAKAPRLGERTRAMLAGELSCPGLEERMGNEQQISLRLPADFLERAESLVAAIASVPDFAAIGEVNRSKVLRLAITRGLEALEAQYGRGASGKASGGGSKRARR